MTRRNPILEAWRRAKKRKAVLDTERLGIPRCPNCVDIYDHHGINSDSVRCIKCDFLFSHSDAMQKAQHEAESK